MNTRFLKWLPTVTVFFCMLFVTTNFAAKKPVPPPPPVDYGSLCADSGSLFPAFAYVFTGEIFLSNSKGDCRISIYKSDDVSADISYRFFGNLETGDGDGKIVWWRRYSSSLGGFTRSKILLLEFQVKAKAITTAFPLVPRLILEEPENFGNVYSPDLNLTGDKVIVAAYETGEVKGYIWEFDIPEIGSVATEVDVLATLVVDEANGLEHATFHGPLYGLSDLHERIYFSYDYPDRKISYIEKGTDNLWSIPTLIAERSAGALTVGSVGLWDYDGTGLGLREVLARSNTVDNTDVIEILDVDACVNSTGSCVVVDGIEGWEVSSFTTFTEGQLPALLYLFDVDTPNVGYSIRECNLSILQSGEMCYRTVINGIKNPSRTLHGVDSAD